MDAVEPVAVTKDDSYCNSTCNLQVALSEASTMYSMSPQVSMSSDRGSTSLSDSISSGGVSLLSEAQAPDEVFLSDETRCLVRSHIEALEDGCTADRYYAAESLAVLGPHAAEALPALLVALREDDSVHVRKSAAFALGMLGKAAQDGMEKLLEASLADENKFVRQEAEFSLLGLRNLSR
mmetsp:Transcript_51263/g.111263  ORF Transcript_51263/g.111263 Transcript_51263/m.111263 type:complete len:180 (-) Transcript_51263:125-664(-)